MKTCNRISGPMTDLHIDLENIFDHFMGDRRSPQKAFSPRTSIVESETNFVLSVELPGVDKNDVSVEVLEGNLVVSGEKKLDELSEGEKLHREERANGKFHRAFEFPTQVDFEKIEASFKSGVLVIDLPKSEKVLPRKIEINLAD